VVNPVVDDERMEPFIQGGHDFAKARPGAPVIELHGELKLKANAAIKNGPPTGR
jgi:hypothetical protein